MYKISEKLKRTISVAILLLIIVIPLGFSVISFLSAQISQSQEPFLEKPNARYRECVRDTDYMRFHHWELLRGLREEVVRDGVRGDLSLDGCWNCHQSKVRFCDRCHDAASVRPDCFGCHYYPDVD